MPTCCSIPEFAGLVHRACGDEGTIPVELGATDLCPVPNEGVQPPGNNIAPVLNFNVII